jgi:hypothetical protein
MLMPLIAAVLTDAPSTTKWRNCGNLARSGSMTAVID